MDQCLNIGNGATHTVVALYSITWRELESGHNSCRFVVC